MGEEGVVVVMREFDPERDSKEVDEIERVCEVGQSGQTSIFTDLLGDPICRIRHAPAFLMLVAVMVKGEEEREIVGMVRGCIKTVTCGKKLSRNGKNGGNDSLKPKPVPVPVPLHVPVYSKTAYILGLRVSPSHRRMGIGLKLVCKIEEWFRENGVEYSYMATEMDNEASVKLFTERCGYSKFRNPSILGHPVYAHRVSITNRVRIFELSPFEAEALYRRRLSTTEFFPRDIDTILNNRLNLGTFIAVPSRGYSYSWPGLDHFLSNPPDSWAVLSIWNSKEVFSVEVRGASLAIRGLAKSSRIVDNAFPWLGIPSMPEVFKPFGFHFLYGLGGHGPDSVKMIKSLCRFAHNFAREKGCCAVVTEVSKMEPLKVGIPYWKKFSCEDDLWCMKRLGEDYSDGSLGDWTKSPPGISIFVDPREI
ncbi:probable N-acetyltransferase HLS1 [Macadamia integrifolia]|uniref:probable N-acetyltransferase HLS1 n=1 Tax=Macadamia integrifolia TaxID=60698 RepID=UPI001C4F503C|nr:probable N-acetyltransferase HLS1 [Macadamia integrifolia]